MPKMSALVEAVPVVVLGGAGLVMFGMVAATGARILQRRRLQAPTATTCSWSRVSIGFGMIPLVAPNFFKQLPHELHPLLESGILLAAIAAVLLNAFFNGDRQQRARRAPQRPRPRTAPKRDTGAGRPKAYDASHA